MQTQTPRPSRPSRPEQEGEGAPLSVPRRYETAPLEITPRGLFRIPMTARPEECRVIAKAADRLGVMIREGG